MKTLEITQITNKYGDDLEKIMAVTEKGQNIEEIEDIGALKSLVRLDVSNNKLTKFGGSIYCYSLTLLNLSKNSITKIPDEISLLTNLVTLNISYNNIKSLAPLKDCKSLKSIIAVENRIKSTKDLKSLATLNTLILSKNEIEDTKGIENLGMLQKLSLSNNKLTTFTPGYGLNQLQELRLNNNKLLKVNVPAPKLRIFDVGNNPIVNKDHFLNSLRSLKKLANLNVNNCFKGLTDDEIKKASPKLTVLNGIQLGEKWREEFFGTIRKNNKETGRVSSKKHVCKVQKIASSKKHKRKFEGTIPKKAKRTKRAHKDFRKGNEKYNENHQDQNEEIKQETTEQPEKPVEKKRDRKEAEKSAEVQEVKPKASKVAKEVNEQDTGIKSVKKVAKDSSKSFSQKSKAEKLKLLEKLHPY
ncbi:unnamed protein product [Moneuplotes crassus]|uniref:Uncharacterized protein n=1 Tax=Euplotes crassus TaxID=5936 RepID=A0AAD1UGV6_EUPCR|nr:unnamed protein product [Moneuplotes crassus]